MKIAFLILVFIFSQVIFEATGQNLVSNCPKCGQPADESRFHAYDDVFKRRWQTPAPGTSQLYQDSYQDYHSLVSYNPPPLLLYQIEQKKCVIRI